MTFANLRSFMHRFTEQPNPCLASLGVISLFAIAAANLAAQRGPQPPPIVKENATVKISDHVYVIPDDSVPVVPNVGIIVGNKATLVVDTGLGTRNGQTVLREVAKVSKNTDLYLVTTHFHPEHAGGASAFPATAKFVVSQAQQKELDELGPDMMKRFAGISPATGELLKDVQLRRGDVFFDQERSIDLGGVRVRLTSPGSMHTRGDTIAFVEPDRVLFAGDVVMNRAFLAFGQSASADTWLKVLKDLEALHAAKVVPSHGPMGDGSIVGEQRAVLEALRARAAELKMQGKSADEAGQMLTAEFQAKYAGWTGPNRIAGAVRSIYPELR
jgi:glyoxylase-like metal-dependent hydrolase (beta-lactamase superfamily II)